MEQSKFMELPCGCLTKPRGFYILFATTGQFVIEVLSLLHVKSWSVFNQ
jgi:hypothetical protein